MTLVSCVNIGCDKMTRIDDDLGHNDRGNMCYACYKNTDEGRIKIREKRRRPKTKQKIDQIMTLLTCILYKLNNAPVEEDPPINQIDVDASDAE